MKKRDVAALNRLVDTWNKLARRKDATIEQLMTGVMELSHGIKELKSRNEPARKRIKDDTMRVDGVQRRLNI